MPTNRTIHLGWAGTTWDPAKKATQISLSGGNLIATANDGSIKTVLSIAGGATISVKKYFRFTVTLLTNAQGNGITVGAMDTSADLNVNQPGNTVCSVGWHSAGGVRAAANDCGTIATFTTGDVLSIAIDFPNRLFWGKVNSGDWNNSGTANPATGTGGIGMTGFSDGTIYAAAALNNNGDIGAANFSATGMPSGFAQWD
jgi:hypothetical protein